MDDYSRQTLHRIAKNDKTLSALMITPNGSRQGIKPMGYFDSTNTTTQFNELALAISTNSHLTTLIVHTAILQDQANNIGIDREFYTSLKRNSSIKSLYIGGRVAGEVVDYEILKAYEENNQQLTDLVITNANLQNGLPVVANTVRLCANLQVLELSSCHITDEQLLPMVESMRHTSRLVKLTLGNNRIGNAGCMALATLIEDPSCNLINLCLNNNIISNEGAAASLVNSLIGNKKLRYLYLENNPTQTSTPLCNSSIHTLCDTSSISNTYLSNHMLQTLILPYPSQNLQPELRELRSLLNLNKEANKSHVAIRKILHFHPNIDVKSLYGWDIEGEWTLKALPYMVDWFNRAMTAYFWNEESEVITSSNTIAKVKTQHINQRKLSAIYQFAQAMPILFVPAKDSTTVKSRVEMKSMNKVATENCCVIL